MGMAKYDRLLYILNLLRTRRNMNAAKIAEECGVNERSIYRDMIALSEANIPIYYDNGYKLATDNFLPPLNFSFDEYQYLKMALSSSVLNRTDKYEAISKQVKAKVEAILSSNVRQQGKFKPDTTHIDIGDSDHSNYIEQCYGTIENAAEKSLCLLLKYDSIQSGVSERIVEPYFIIFKGRAFYLVAFCRLRNDFRTFRINRILSAEPIDETFVRRGDITAEEYFKGSWQVYSGEPVEVVIRFTGSAAKVVRTDHHHENERIQEVGKDTILYTVVTRGLEEIGRWVIGFGADAEVISPKQLKASLAAVGNYLTITYQEG